MKKFTTKKQKLSSPESASVENQDLEMDDNSIREGSSSSSSKTTKRKKVKKFFTQLFMRSESRSSITTAELPSTTPSPVS
ncbi:hypothetical protein GE061_016030 [Apolygus lucorum]|uniref:Uncharacterized protein n=1 Tax=Apolygus lucorum TaxID=248454 RepID=A0A6A4K3W0_APOLU|nr:hypothetical protein GE061_016030 [Apolygus lucorum]